MRELSSTNRVSQRRESVRLAFECHRLGVAALILKNPHFGPDSPNDSGPPGAIGCAIRARQGYFVSVGIPQPNLPVIWAAVAVRRVPVARQDDFGSHGFRTRHGGLEVIDLEPQERGISRGKTGISDVSVKMLHVPIVQLQDEAAVDDEALIVGHNNHQ